MTGKYLRLVLLLIISVFLFLAVKASQTNWDKLGEAYASGEALTITAPTTFNNAAGVIGVKFIDTTDSGAYYVDPGGSTSMVLAGSASIEGNTTIGNASSDTLTANAASWTFANDTNFVLSGGVNGLSFDTSTFSVDSTNHRVGVGTTAPGALLDVGLAGSTLGVIRLAGNTSGNVSLQPNAAAGTNIVLTLPATTGTANVASFNSVLGANALGGTVPASSTRYLAPFISGLQSSAVNSTLPVSGTLSKLTFFTSTTQPNSGTLRVTVFINGASTGMYAEVAPSGVAGTYVEYFGGTTISVSAGDKIRFEIINGATSASAAMAGVGLQIY